MMEIMVACLLCCRVQFRPVTSKCRLVTIPLTWRRSGVACTSPYWSESDSSGQNLRGKPGNSVLVPRQPGHFKKSSG